MSEPSGDIFRRELPEFISVTVEGDFYHIDPDVTERTPGRVVIAMPDFTADALAHSLAYLAKIADGLDQERVGVGERELAQALFDAAQAAGYRCPSGQLDSEVGNA
jgi:hypothetical protein